MVARTIPSAVVTIGSATVAHASSSMCRIVFVIVAGFGVVRILFGIRRWSLGK
jgi:hypothetical protein